MRLGKRHKQIITLITIIAVLLILHGFGLLVGAENLIAGGFSKIQSSLFNSSQNIHNNLSDEMSAVDYQKEANRLSLEVADLTKKIADLEHLRAENQTLRSLLDYVPEMGYEKIVAEVISAELDLPNTYKINRGRAAGISVGEAVIVGEGSIVAQIIAVDEFTSSMTLITDRQVKLPVSKEGEEESIGVTEGEFGLSILIKLIPQNEEISEGQVIVTSDLQSGVPYGLIIGKVNRIISQPNDLFKQASIVPLVDLKNLRIVQVLTSEF